MKVPKFIFSATRGEIEQTFKNIPAYRASQIINWIYKNWETCPSEMKNLPLALREELSEKFIWQYPKIISCEQTSDMTTKFLLELYDKEYVEFVIIKSLNRNTLCLSSQVGCPVRCNFCASGLFGLKRNLYPGEMIAQFLLASKSLNCHPDNVVFMGIGEPLLNFNNLVESLEIICSPEYINYSARRITISTSGIPEMICKLAELKKQWNLAVSIHAPDDIIRSALIPDSCRFPLKEIFDACKIFYEKTGRLVTLEYTLIKGLNDKKEHAIKLAEIAKQLRAKINLIAYNPTPNSKYVRPEEKACLNFYNTLKKHGAKATFRLEKGAKIDAACGQLRIKEHVN